MQEYIEFARMHPLLVIGFITVLGLIIWSEYSRLTRKYKQVNANEAVQILNKDNVTLIDVREASEVSNGIIKGAKKIPLGELATQIPSLEKNKDKPILVYCRSGSRSGSACNTLTQHGFSDVYNLAGGIMSWESENLPLSRK